MAQAHTRQEMHAERNSGRQQPAQRAELAARARHQPIAHFRPLPEARDAERCRECATTCCCGTCVYVCVGTDYILCTRMRVCVFVWWWWGTCNFEILALLDMRCMTVSMVCCPSLGLLLLCRHYGRHWVRVELSTILIKYAFKIAIQLARRDNSVVPMV